MAISLLSGFFDKYVVDGLVNFSGWLMRAGSRFFRGLQTGVVSQYALVLGLGTFILVVYFVSLRSSGWRELHVRLDASDPDPEHRLLPAVGGRADRLCS